jgi:hypothetical protein
VLGVKVHVHRGFIARSIGQVMEEKHAHPEANIIVYMSYLEIYEEVCFYAFLCCKRKIHGVGIVSLVFQLGSLSLALCELCNLAANYGRGYAITRKCLTFYNKGILT